MTLYIGITIWLFVLLLFSLKLYPAASAEGGPSAPRDNTGGRGRSVLSVLALATLLFLWFLTAFRSARIGNDTQNYLMFFDLFSGGIDRQNRIEIGYQYLNFFISKITRDHHAFLIIISTIMYAGIGFYLYRYSVNPVVSLCLFFSFFFTVYASIIRQALAMLIALYGYQCLKNGKRIPAALLFLTAMTFHATAIVCFLLFFDFKFLQNKWIVIGFTLFCVLFALSGTLKTIVNAIGPKYRQYFDSQYANSGRLAITYYMLCYLSFYLLVNKSIDAAHRPDRTVTANFALLLVITAFGYAVNLFERASEYFMLVAVTELPNMLYRGKMKYHRLWILGICAVFLTMFILILIFRPGWNYMYPYEFWPGQGG